MRRGAGNHAADNTVSGVISAGATWSETATIKDQNGDDVTGLTGHSFQFQFRRCSDDSPDLTLSTAEGTLSISESEGVTTLTINVPQASLSSMCGDYIADLASKTGSTITHRAHGIVTFRNDPVAF